MRDVAKALAELIGATKCASGKVADDPSMYQLKSAAKVKKQPRLFRVNCALILVMQSPIPHTELCGGQHITAGHGVSGLQ